MPYTVLLQEQKKASLNPPKGTRKLSSGASGSTQKTVPKLDTKKSDFLRWRLFGGNAAFEPWTLEMGPQLYID